MSEVKTYSLGDWVLQSGQIIPNAHITFKVFGSLSSPVIIYPTWFSGRIEDNEWLIGPDRVLNPSKYCIIIPAMFGNGQSTSPSNTALRPFPNVTFHDNVRAQHRLITAHLGIRHVRAVVGWSMAAGQTFQWATQFPDFMDIAVPFCGASRTSLHNQVMIEGVKVALITAAKQVSAGVLRGAKFDDGESGRTRTWSAEEQDRGLRSLGRVYAGWGFSQPFYREKLYESYLGFKDLEDFLVNFWEKWATSKDPENMLAMLETWQSADVSKQEPYNGDFRAAMQAIKAKTLVLPAKTDLYFPPEDSEIEVANMREGVGKLDIFPSIWGHWAGGPGDSKEDGQWLDERLREIGL